MMGHRIALNFEDRVTRRMRSEDYATTQRRLAMADVLAELPEEVITARPDPSAGRVRLTPPICTMGEDTHFTQFDGRADHRLHSSVGLHRHPSLLHRPPRRLSDRRRPTGGRRDSHCRDRRRGSVAAATAGRRFSRLRPIRDLSV